MKSNLIKAMMFIFVTLISLTLIGCSTANVPNETIGIRGIVKEISTSGHQGQLLVEGEIEEDTVYDKASVSITEETLIQKKSLSSAFELADIQVGDTVEVIFTGPVAESYPVQGTASIIKIITN